LQRRSAKSGDGPKLTELRLGNLSVFDPKQTSLKGSNGKIYRQSSILPKMPFQANLGNKPLMGNTEAEWTVLQTMKELTGCSFEPVWATYNFTEKC
jgi:hypothetical protein